MNDTADKPTLASIEKSLTDRVIESYNDNDRLDYDFMTTAFVVNRDDELCICAIVDGAPRDQLPKILEQLGAKMYGFACATWQTHVDLKTGERTKGEGFVLSFDDGETYKVYTATVTRNPLPTLGEFKLMPEEAGGALSHLLSRRQGTTEHG